MKAQRFITALLISFLLLATLAPVILADHTASASGKDLRILFTHDIHSSILPYDMQDSSGNRSTRGGYARLATLIKQNQNDASILVDGGDFSMGTMFNSIFENHAPDLALMGEMGYDVTTIGNHEFDYGANGLKNDLLAASKLSKKPLMLNSNMIFGDDPTSQEISLDTSISFINAGYIRDTIFKGDLTQSGIYNLLSLGTGPDGKVGFPMADFYLYGAELKTLCQFDASVSPIMWDTQFFFSGLRYTYNNSRLPLDKVMSVETKVTQYFFDYSPKLVF